jgi:hypothetical protein
MNVGERLRNILVSDVGEERPVGFIVRTLRVAAALVPEKSQQGEQLISGHGPHYPGSAYSHMRNQPVTRARILIAFTWAFIWVGWAVLLLYGLLWWTS